MMANWLARWLGSGRGKSVATRPVTEAASLGTRGMATREVSASVAEDVSRLGSAFGDFVRLPNETPFSMLEVYRFLRDAIPDISDAVWTWKRLCQTGYDIEITKPSSEVAKGRAERLLHELDRRVNGGDRGMDGLLDVFYTSLFTYGAAAVEIVLTPSRKSIFDVVPVDVWTVRFKREAGRLQPYQIHDGEAIRLPTERFVYVGLDRDESVWAVAVAERSAGGEGAAAAD